MKRYVIIKRGAGGIATKYATLFPRSEVGISSVVVSQGFVGIILRTAVFHNPNVGIGGFCINRFKRKTDRTALIEVGKNIIGAGIFVNAPHRTVSSRDKPDTSELCIDHEARTMVCPPCFFLNVEITFLHFGKKRIGTYLFSEKATIKTHPFGSSQRRALHIIGTFDNGNV